MRNFVVSLALVAAAFAVGCSRSEKASSAAAPGEGASAESAAPSEPVSAAPAKPYAGVDYECGGGASFNAKLDKGNALVTIDGKTSTLAPAGGMGSTYEGEGLTYIPNGNEATLVREGQAPQSCKAKAS